MQFTSFVENIVNIRNGWFRNVDNDILGYHPVCTSTVTVADAQYRLILVI